MNGERIGISEEAAKTPVNMRLRRALRGPQIAGRIDTTFDKTIDAAVGNHVRVGLNPREAVANLNEQRAAAKRPHLNEDGSAPVYERVGIDAVEISSRGEDLGIAPETVTTLVSFTTNGADYTRATDAEREALARVGINGEGRTQIGIAFTSEAMRMVVNGNETPIVHNVRSKENTSLEQIEPLATFAEQIILAREKQPTRKS
jgi:hypothetical protein